MFCLCCADVIYVDANYRPCCVILSIAMAAIIAAITRAAASTPRGARPAASLLDYMPDGVFLQVLYLLQPQQLAILCRVISLHTQLKPSIRSLPYILHTCCSDT
jgi:hypothetical protein